MKEDRDVVLVGIAGGAVEMAPTRIRTLGLGSCVAVILYDLSAQAGGLVHVLLPESPMDAPPVPTKFADTAIPWLMTRLLDRGASLEGMVAKLAGGAQMFASLQPAQSAVGSRNIEVCRRVLEQYSIVLAAQDVGGNYGRSVELETATGTVVIRTAVRGSYIL